MTNSMLNPHQLTAIQYFALPRSQRPSVEDIAAECKVSRATLYTWRRDPVFEAELKRQMARYALDDLPDLIAAVTTMAIEDRSAAMAKLALQVNGMLADKIEVQSSPMVETGMSDVEALKARISALRRQTDADTETIPSSAVS